MNDENERLKAARELASHIWGGEFDIEVWGDGLTLANDQIGEVLACEGPRALDALEAALWRLADMPMVLKNEAEHRAWIAGFFAARIGPSPRLAQRADHMVWAKRAQVLEQRIADIDAWKTKWGPRGIEELETILTAALPIPELAQELSGSCPSCEEHRMLEGLYCIEGDYTGEEPPLGSALQRLSAVAQRHG